MGFHRFKSEWIAAALLASTAVWAAPAKDNWQAGFAFYTENGDYNTGSNSSTVYAPFSLRRYFEPGDVTLIIPSISVTTEGQVVVVAGVPNASGRGPGTGGGTAVIPRVTHSGLGDIVLKGRYYTLPEKDWFPAVDALAEIKFPTASRSDDLGTGEFDEGFSLQFTKTVTDRVLALADAGYTFVGSPPGESLNNQWHYSLGPGYYFIPEKLLGSVSFEEDRALVNSDSNPMDLLFSAQYDVTRKIRIDGGVQAGLTRSAADFGVNIGVQVKFQDFQLPPSLAPRR